MAQTKNIELFHTIRKLQFISTLVLKYWRVNFDTEKLAVELGCIQQSNWTRNREYILNCHFCYNYFFAYITAYPAYVIKSCSSSHSQSRRNPWLLYSMWLKVYRLIAQHSGTITWKPCKNYQRFPFPVPLPFTRRERLVNERETSHLAVAMKVLITKLATVTKSIHTVLCWLPEK